MPYSHNPSIFILYFSTDKIQKLAYWIVFQLETFSIGQRWPPLCWRVLVWCRITASSFFLDKEDFTAGLIFIVRALPCIYYSKKKEKQNKENKNQISKAQKPPSVSHNVTRDVRNQSPAVLQVLTELKYLTALRRYKYTHRHTCLFPCTYTWHNKLFLQNYVNKNQWCHEHISPLGIPYFFLKETTLWMKLIARMPPSWNMRPPFAFLPVSLCYK